MKNRMQYILKTNLLVLFTGVNMLFFSTTIHAQEIGKRSLFDIMSYTEMLNLTIETEVDSLIENRRSAAEYPSIIRFEDQDKQTQNFDVKISLRGNFRRMRCSGIPPLKLNFKKKALTAAGLAKFDDFKLVTYCIDDNSDAKALLLKEFLAYKLYNGITDESFRVQLLNITFKDHKTGRKTKQWGFIIEDTAELRNRLGAKKVEETRNVAFEKFNRAQIRQVALFQYLIGNSDWDLTVSRNVKYINKDGQYLAIPYDFDFSGLVNAPYAIANPNFNLASVQDRVYLGFEEDMNHLNATITQLHDKQTDLIQIVEDFKLLKGSARKEIKVYLNSYFENALIIETPKQKLVIAKVGD